MEWKRKSSLAVLMCSNNPSAVAISRVVVAVSDTHQRTVKLDPDYFSVKELMYENVASMKEDANQLLTGVESSTRGEACVKALSRITQRENNGVSSCFCVLYRDSHPELISSSGAGVAAELQIDSN